MPRISTDILFMSSLQWEINLVFLIWCNPFIIAETHPVRPIPAELSTKEEKVEENIVNVQFSILKKCEHTNG